MPIIVPKDIPAAKILQSENIFVMNDKRAMQQDIRPLEIAIVNLMPTKIVTETQLMRLLSNSPLQVNITLISTETYIGKNTSLEHLDRFYKSFTEIKTRKFDGMIITGAPVEEIEFSEVKYWKELEDILEFAEVFRFAKRSGGNFGKIIQNTIFRIGEKIETEHEIQTILAGRKMEQKVMNIVPVGLLLYLNLTSKEFLAPLYGNFFGICVMSVAFFVYLVALALSKKMIQIQL